MIKLTPYLTMKSEESIFAEAIELPKTEQLGFVSRQCGDDRAMKERLLRMIEAHNRTDSFLDHADSDETSWAELPIEPDQQIGRYRLLQKLGEGGFGVVYMAEQREPVRRKVALKLIKPGMDSKAVVARFEAERQALAMMDHPNIATVFDGGSIELAAGPAAVRRPWFVMELVQGVPITEYSDTNSLSTAQRLELFTSVCSAVHHAHQKGIIHRDIKPSNVMVTLHDGQPVVKVIDFGVAKALHQRLTEKTMFTRYGQMIGTPQYMSPEQAEMSGLDVDTRSDVYSLAVLLYELLTGTTPLRAEALREAGYHEMQRMIREDEPAKPSHRISSSGQQLTTLARHRSVSPDRLPREIRGDLDWIVMKGLEKDRRRRYDSASDFAADIRRSLDDQPVVAGPPSIAYQTRKFLFRNRIGVATAMVAILLLSIIAGIMIGNRNSRLAAQQLDEQRLSDAIDEATSALITATGAAPNDDRWASAGILMSQVNELMETSTARQPLLDRAGRFLDSFRAARRDREFAAAIEELLINKATNMDLESWTRMEQEFRRILRDRGFDVDNESPEEIGRRIREDKSRVQLADALELWIGTRGQMATFGGPKLNAKMMQPWAEAMFVADPDPLRTAIRKIIYQIVPADSDYLEKVVAESDLEAASPRTLSWLAITFLMTGNPERSNEIHRFAFSRHPDDLMLNFDFALTLMNQRQWDKAIRYYMRCTAIRPEVPGIWRGLAQAYYKNDEVEAARGALELAIGLQPDHAPAHLELARMQLDQENYVVATDSAQTAIELDSELASAYRLLGRSQMKLGERAKARESLERYRKLSGDNTDTEVEQWLQEMRSAIEAQSDEPEK